MGRRGEPCTHLPPEQQSLLALEEKWAQAQQPGKLSSREHMAEGGGEGEFSRLWHHFPESSCWTRPPQGPWAQREGALKTRLSRPLEGPNGEDREGAGVRCLLQLSEGREMSSETDSAWDGTTIIPQGLFYSPLESWVREVPREATEPKMTSSTPLLNMRVGNRRAKHTKASFPTCSPSQL